MYKQPLAAYKIKRLINGLGCKFVCTFLKLHIFKKKKKLIQAAYTYILKQQGQYAIRDVDT